MDSFFILKKTDPYPYHQDLDKEPFLRSVMKTDPCPFLVKYSPDVLKKITKVLDNFEMNKTCFVKIKVGPSPKAI